MWQEWVCIFASKHLLIYLLFFSKAKDAEWILEVNYLSVLVEVEIRCMLRTSPPPQKKHPKEKQE